MELSFTSIRDQPRGLIASMLKRSYAALLAADASNWLPEVYRWEEFDREVFDNPNEVGACVFLSWSGDQLVGFASYDPRQRPDVGIVGHNCILPEFRGNGFGKEQIKEVLRRFRTMGISLARVSTLDTPFFTPARRIYAACGFRETARHPWDVDPLHDVIEYEVRLENHGLSASL